MTLWEALRIITERCRSITEHINYVYNLPLSVVIALCRCILLYDVPILQSAEERAGLEAESKGHMDVVYTYQSALGTFGKHWPVSAYTK